MSTIEVKVPDIGDFTDIPIIEIFVAPGDIVRERFCFGRQPTIGQNRDV